SLRRTRKVSVQSEEHGPVDQVEPQTASMVSSVKRQNVLTDREGLPEVREDHPELREDHPDLRGADVPELRGADGPRQLPPAD
ncbi:MAG TPA: hypothetical protein VE666_14165, partial [Mycobacterium sp.]|nr:hypothetical protein [Mycobacterium sp.]